MTIEEDKPKARSFTITVTLTGQQLALLVLLIGGSAANDFPYEDYLQLSKFVDDDAQLRSLLIAARNEKE